jgi:hypothetical protein
MRRAHISTHTFARAASSRGFVAQGFDDEKGTYYCAVHAPEPKKARYFESGATRDSDDGKLDYEGFLAPGVLERYGQYMHRNREQSDGVLRDSDNWQKGIPRDQYMKSMWRHFMEVWADHRNNEEDMPYREDNLCALLFNVMGYLFELQQGR